MKHRVLCHKGRFRVQRKVLWWFWVNVYDTQYDRFGNEINIDYDTLNEALVFVRRMKEETPENKEIVVWQS
jgi:hypothetical protein